jgi:hypothetical protein
MPRREFKEIKLRAIDCEKLGFQVTFVTCSTDEEREQCKNNAARIAEEFFPEPKDEN